MFIVQCHDIVNSKSFNKFVLQFWLHYFVQMNIPARPVTGHSGPATIVQLKPIAPGEYHTKPDFLFTDSALPIKHCMGSALPKLMEAARDRTRLMRARADCTTIDSSTMPSEHFEFITMLFR